MSEMKPHIKEWVCNMIKEYGKPTNEIEFIVNPLTKEKYNIPDVLYGIPVKSNIISELEFLHLRDKQ